MPAHQGEPYTFWGYPGLEIRMFERQIMFFLHQILFTKKSKDFTARNRVWFENREQQHVSQ